VIRVRTLTDGGQSAEDVAAELVAFLGVAHESLDLALYDVRLPGPVGDTVAGALRAAQARGVAVRIVFNRPGGTPAHVIPPPPSTRPDVLETLGVPVRAVPGDPDLMHHKFAVRDAHTVWTGSANWTLDSWTRQENVLVQVESAGVAADFRRVFDDLWARQEVDGSGDQDAAPTLVDGVPVRAWFSPGRGPELSHRIAKAIGAAHRRVRIASPVLTAGPILGTLAEVTAERRVDVRGVCDWTQLRAVFDQWQANPRSRWKAPLLARVLEDGDFRGKRSAPYAPGAVHDVLHAKVAVADDTVFAGSFNLSRSGEQNAENVLEIRDAGLADRLAAYVDELRERYPDVDPPG
jgi:phosphatidylserine/phosphatidylglycerophosphate/cardiolipin synthase-like enzyme